MIKDVIFYNFTQLSDLFTGVPKCRVFTFQQVYAISRCTHLQMYITSRNYFQNYSSRLQLGRYWTYFFKGVRYYRAERTVVQVYHFFSVERTFLQLYAGAR